MPVDLRLGIGDSLPVTTELDFVDEPVMSDGSQYVDFSGLRGSRSRPANRVRNVGGVPSGSCNFRPTPTELAVLLKYIRSAGSGTPKSYAFTESLNEFAITTKNTTGGAKRDMTGCKVSRAEFSASKGQALQLALSWMGRTFARSTAAFPSLSIDETTQPFVFEDCDTSSIPNGDLTVNGVAITAFDVSVSIDHGLTARQVNQLRPSLLYATDHVVEWRLTIPWNSYSSLDPLSSSGVTVLWSMENATHVLRLESPKVAFSPQPLSANGREEEVLTLVGQARWGAVKGDELTIQLDEIGVF